MKKKLSLLMMAMVLLIGILSGCGGSGSSSGDKVDIKNKKDVKGNITVWGWNVAADAMRKAVPAFNKEYPNVKVKVEDIGRLDVYKKLTVGLAANGSGLPDVALVEDDHIQNYLTQFPDGFMNLGKSGYDQSIDQFSKSKMGAVKNKKGDIYAMPWDIGPVEVFYRTDLFKKAGVDPASIKTWDDYLNAGKKIKAATGVDLLSMDIANDDGLFRIMLNEQGTYYFDDKGNINLESNEAVKAMSMIKKLHDANVMLNVDGWNGGIAAMKNSKVATIPTGVWYTGTMMDQAPDLSGKWDAFKLPAFEAGGNQAANLGGSNLMIPSSTNNKAAAYAFAKFFTTNADVQVQSMKKDGLFPSLTSSYDKPFFSENVAYFNNQPVFKSFSDTVPNIKSINYTSDNDRALKIGADTVSSVLLDNKDPQAALKNAAEGLKKATHRDISK